MPEGILYGRGKGVEFTTYRIRGKTWVTLSPDVDRCFWGIHGETFHPEQTFTSFGQAYARVGHQRFPPLKGRWAEGAHEMERLATSLHLPLEGRALTWDEVTGDGREERDSRELEAIRKGMQWLILTGRATLFPGVEASGAALGWRCHRCGGGANQIRTGSCARCEGLCAWCDRCVTMGRSKACTPFFLVEPLRGPSDGGEVALRLPPFSAAQEDAAAKGLEWLEGKREGLLVWAVTGSGKTEILFPAVRRALEQEERVLWVSPRREVVSEVSERMRRAFPGTEVAEVHGETGEIWENRPLTVATIQQAVRFYRRFRLVVVDEADAFPLREDPRWLSGLRRTLIDGGQQAFLTATPPRHWRRWVRQGKVDSVTVPARFHGHPLPVPKRYRVWQLWRRVVRGRSIPRLEAFLERIAKEKGQALLFVPRISDAGSLLDWMKSRCPGLESVSSFATGKDEKRREKITAFMEGRLRILVTTTILERGVTVPRCHVLVVGADHPVFDRAALIQIAGRVGRDPSCPRGEVWFLSSVSTEAQVGAIREIQHLNRYAREKGYLSAEGSGP